MNNSKTPKIVVGVGLVAVYAAGLTFLTLRETNDSAVAQSLPAAESAQMVAAPAEPALGLPESTNTLASADALAPELSTPAATPAPVAPTPAASTAARAPEATRPTAAAQPAPRPAEVPLANLPSPRSPVPSDAGESSRSNTGTNEVSEFVAAEDAVPGESVTSEEDTSSVQDSPSTAEASEPTLDE